MLLGSSELLNLNSIAPVRRSRLCVVEWSIAALFILTLLLSSGVFFKASKVADKRVQVQASKSEKSRSAAPGTLGAISSNAQLIKSDTLLPIKSLAKSVEGISCELIP
ncbi:MAG TPA: hypothetical protein VIM41_12820 [Gammaproteobacteria bacterium]